MTTPDDFVTRLARSHGEPLQRFLRARVRNPADIQDLMQEVFLRMVRIPSHDAIRSPEAYLFTIARHVAQQHALRQSSAPLAVEVESLLAHLPAADGDPSAELQANQLIGELDEALERLNPKVRATFVLHRHHGLTLEEIARELKISFPMAKKYLVKALVLVRRHLEDAGQP